MVREADVGIDGKGGGGSNLLYGIGMHLFVHYLISTNGFSVYNIGSDGL